MYEIDNRYPEVAVPYEKIRGVRHHGGVGGAGTTQTMKRAMRANNLKRSFWTSAAAVTVAVALFLVAPGKAAPADDAAPFLDPAVSLVSAACSDTRPDTLEYRYEVEMNDAEAMDVSVFAYSDAGELLGRDGPFPHTGPGVSEPAEITLDRTDGVPYVILAVEGAYTRDGMARTVLDSRKVELPGPPEPPPEPPFSPPVLAIADAALHDPDVTPLTFRYQITLNDAESLNVTAEIAADDGSVIGTAGPFLHTEDGSSPVCSAELALSERPASVTLMLTGTYTENGEEKTVSATLTLVLPEPGYYSLELYDRYGRRWSRDFYVPDSAKPDRGRSWVRVLEFRGLPAGVYTAVRKERPLLQFEVRAGERMEAELTIEN